MARFLLNPTFDIESGRLIGHDGQFEIEHVPMRCDRGATKQAKDQGVQAGSAAGVSGTEAATDRSAVIPGLIQEANNPTGYTPQQKNNLLVSQQQAAGGANATVGGEGRLAALRTRTAGGFAPALAEAARSKGRTLATGALDVANQDAMLQQENQQRARQQLLGLYGTDTSNQLKSMGLQGEDLNNQLAAGRQGWFQNTLAGIDAAKGSQGPMSYI